MTSTAKVALLTCTLERTIEPYAIAKIAASVHVMHLPKATLDAHTQPMQSHIKVGCGQDITIKELALAVGTTVGFQGQIDFDPTKPDGSPRKLMDSSRLNDLGWSSKVGLTDGLNAAYLDFLEHQT